jgi:hypothetical protein
MELGESQLIQIITAIVQKHGCVIKALDVKNQVIDIDGPPESKVACAKELEVFLE